MTDVNPNSTAPDEDDDLFEAATEEFPSKYDLRDRLVVIYPNGKTGQRKSEKTGKAYDWYETTTVVLDDGPNGWQEMVPGDDGMKPNLVPSVVADGPQVLVNFQWSAGGFTSRLATKVAKDGGKPGSVLGRVNSRKNKISGMSPSWSISAPTDEDMATARKATAVCRAARDEIVKANQAAQDEAAFD